MAEFQLTISGSVKAKNIESASAKLEALKEWMQRNGWEAPDVRLKGAEK